jgi:hypothetical protein
LCSRMSQRPVYLRGYQLVPRMLQSRNAHVMMQAQYMARLDTLAFGSMVEREVQAGGPSQKTPNFVLSVVS